MPAPMTTTLGAGEGAGDDPCGGACGDATTESPPHAASSCSVTAEPKTLKSARLSIAILQFIEASRLVRLRIYRLMWRSYGGPLQMVDTPLSIATDWRGTVQKEHPFRAKNPSLVTPGIEVECLVYPYCETKIRQSAIGPVQATSWRQHLGVESGHSKLALKERGHKPIRNLPLGARW